MNIIVKPKPKKSLKLIDTNGDDMELTALLQYADNLGFENTIVRGVRTKWFKEVHNDLFSREKNGIFCDYKKTTPRALLKKFSEAMKQVTDKHFTAGQHSNDITGEDDEGNVYSYLPLVKKFLETMETNPSAARRTETTRNERRRVEYMQTTPQASLGNVDRTQVRSRTELSRHRSLDNDVRSNIDFSISSEQTNIVASPLLVDPNETSSISSTSTRLRSRTRSSNAREDSSGTTPSSTAMRNIIGDLESSVQMLVESASNINDFNENNEATKKKRERFEEEEEKEKNEKETSRN